MHLDLIYSFPFKANLVIFTLKMFIKKHAAWTPFGWESTLQILC